MIKENYKRFIQVLGNKEKTITQIHKELKLNDLSATQRLFDVLNKCKLLETKKIKYSRYIKLNKTGKSYLKIFNKI